MLRNVKLKKFLVQNVFPVFSFINKYLPKKENCILIYCANDNLSDNSETLYKYLVDNNYYEKYRIYCILKNYKNYTSPNKARIKFVSQTFGTIKYLFSKYMFYSMGKIPIKPSKEQVIINMWHGIPLKSIGHLSQIDNGEEFFFTYVCASSELFRPIMAAAFGCPEKNVCICGEPKADRLFAQRKKDSTNKLILWTPTFRQSKYLGYSDSTETNFLPLFENNEWIKLNDMLKKKGLKLVAKLHPGQDLNGFEEEILSNLEVYSSMAFEKEKGDLYEMLSLSDALITDYSSVYFNYLLLNRPIGFDLSDIKEYSDSRGFVFENPLDYMPGEKLYSKEDLFKFLDDIAVGKNNYVEERKRVCNLVHQYQDGKNCERLLKIAGITKE